MRAVVAWLRRWRGTRVAGPAPAERSTEEQLAAGLAAFGVSRGSRVAVLGLPEDDADVVTAAVLRCGATPVAVPQHSTGARLRVRLREVDAAVTERAHAPQVVAVAGDLPRLRQVWCWQDGGRQELLAAAHGRMPVFTD